MVTIRPLRARPRRYKITPLRIFVALALLIMLVGGSTLYVARTWAPSRTTYPVQGVTVSAESGEVIWQTARAAGVDFAYLLATIGADARDPAFLANLAAARELGIRHGAIHRYSLCRSATAQATEYIANVPRADDMLPPVIQLDFWPDCPTRPSRDRLLAELNTFLNQIEAHSGKPAILRLSRPFEGQYELSSGINRTLWLEGNGLAPDYATRPWVIWTASTWRRVPGIHGAVEWDVVKP